MTGNAVSQLNEGAWGVRRTVELKMVFLVWRGLLNG
jgi:hypothetical protein